MKIYFDCVTCLIRQCPDSVRCAPNWARRTRDLRPLGRHREFPANSSHRLKVNLKQRNSRCHHGESALRSSCVMKKVT